MDQKQSIYITHLITAVACKNLLGYNEKGRRLFVNHVGACGGLMYLDGGAAMKLWKDNQGIIIHLADAVYNLVKNTVTGDDSSQVKEFLDDTN